MKTVMFGCLRHGSRRLGWPYLAAAGAALALSAVAHAAEPAALRFEVLTVEDGLPQVSVHAIVQDRTGFLWFGTQMGICRFDGVEFMTIRREPGSSAGLSDNLVRSALIDSVGRLWVGTNAGGLNLVDPERGTVVAFPVEENNPKALPHPRVDALIEAPDGRVWVGTFGRGSWALDTSTGVFAPVATGEDRAGSRTITALERGSAQTIWLGTEAGLYRCEADRLSCVAITVAPAGLANVRIRAVLDDARGVVWLGTDTGLVKYQPATGASERVAPMPAVAAARIDQLLSDRAGNLWLGTRGAGVVRWNPSTGDAVHLRHDRTQSGSLPENNVFSLFEDRAGTIWVGTYQGGVGSYHPGRIAFPHVKSNPLDAKSLSTDGVRGFAEDAQGRLWVGTTGAGLNRWDGQRGGFVHYRHNPTNHRSVASDFIRCLLTDRRGRLWIGTDGGGLDLYDPGSDSFLHHRYAATDGASLASDNVYAMVEDERGMLWVGTEGGGLDRFDPTTGRFVHHRHDPSRPDTLSSDSIYSLFIDSHGVLWIGTRGHGLNRLRPGSGAFERLSGNGAQLGARSASHVICIREDGAGRLWLATWGGGLNRFIPESGSFVAFTEREGCPSNMLSGILPDDQGFLWVSSIRGLARFDPNRSTFRKYDVYDGLQSLGFNGAAHYRGRDGRLYFGGVNGYNVFRPSEIRDLRVAAPLVVTGIQVFDQPIPFVPRTMTEQPVVLGHRQNFVSFTFAALDYVSPRRLQYSYQLEGVDPDWVQAGSRRFARYTGLGAGTFVFRVRASDRFGAAGRSEASARLIIEPPFWRTWWFRSLVLLVVAAAVFAWYRERVVRVRRLNRLLEAQVKERTAQLSRRNTQLECINTIVKSINRDIDLGGLLDATVESARMIKGAEKAVALVKEEERDVFRIRASWGWDEHDLDLLEFSSSELEARYTSRSEEVLQDIFVTDSTAGLPIEDRIAVYGIPKAMMVMRVRVEGVIAAYVVFDNMRDPNAFDDQDMLLLSNLQDHIISAFLKSRMLGRLRVQAESLERAYADLERVSITDPLTGAKNRRFLLNTIELDIAKIRRSHPAWGKEISSLAQSTEGIIFLIVDIDHFKKVNDLYGHENGDRVLVQIANALREICRGQDVVIRWGGEEFLVVARFSEAEGGPPIAGRILHGIAGRTLTLDDGREIARTCSVGYAALPFVKSAPDALTWEQVVGVADRAMYCAKQSGRNAWVGLMATPTTPATGLLRAVQEDLAALVARGELMVASSLPAADLVFSEKDGG
jgi:diguanylate cyclase (GGDEF)-like protein